MQYMEASSEEDEGSESGNGQAGSLPMGMVWV